MIAALYVIRGGVYYDLADVDPWDEQRDARLYAGPYSVVAHPPCARWGRYYWGGPSSKVRHKLGDDGGCFERALSAVRRYGGVLEHPAYSRAWAAFGLNTPHRDGRWWAADWHGGWTCHVEQGHYGHRARKATWLYAVGVALPELTWGPSALAVRPPSGITAEQRAARREWLLEYERRTGKAWCCPELLTKRERAATPAPFRDLLLSIAATARGRTVAA